MGRVYGSEHDLDRLVTTHLFNIGPNGSGSSFLQQAMATSRATWNLAGEGQHMGGFAGPTPQRLGCGMLWASDSRWVDIFADPGAYDWRRNRRAWYFQAFARHPGATVFFTKSPPFLLQVAELVRNFRNAKFVFMVRNPYAICEGICRYQGARLAARGQDALTLAARHVAACLRRQRRNVEEHGDRGVLFTYEAMCDEPARVARLIRSLVPAIDDLELRRKFPVKGVYNEMLTNMNERQISRLDRGQVALLNKVFERHEATLGHFGYRLIAGDR